MIRFPQISQYIKKFTSLRGVSDVVHSSATSPFERIPLKDEFVVSNNILTENPKALIKKLIAEKNPAHGKDACVFQIPGQPDYVLRVEQTAIPKIDDLPENLKLIPIEHSPTIANNDNLGLPLYSVIGENSPLYSRKTISPIEALAQKDNITVLRKVSGHHPANGTFKSLMKMIGISDNEPNVPKYLDFRQLMYIRKTYGPEAANKCMQELKKGNEVTIPENFFEAGSQAFTFTNCEEFVADHRNVINTYLNELKDISEMPQQAYKKAVSTIVADKNFLVDFQHTGNTFVDTKNNRFNFMDFEYDKNNAKYIYENPVREFRNVLLGKCFCKELKSPTLLLFDEKEINQCKELIARISQNVNDAAPDEFKFLK